MRICCFLVALTAWQIAAHGQVKFKKYALSDKYISEGIAVADVDKDGKQDLLTGSFWWKAPKWERIGLTNPYIHPSIDGYGNSFLNFSLDVNNDGWIDMIKVGHPGEASYWYENPKNKPGYWKERVLYPSVGNESPAFVDVDGDGREDIICNDAINKKVLWLSAPVENNDTTWTPHIISIDSNRATHKYTHGLGLGDINGDGRKDVVIRDGWWEAPEDRKQENWIFHAANLGEDCAQMYVFDVDKDGDNDVITSSAHQYGIWWYEHKHSDTGIIFSRHEIFTRFSQSHGLAFDDINEDGNPDLITGKRFWAHNGHDPGEREPAVIYWFEFVPGKNPKWLPHLIDDNSGGGLQLVITDINRDSKKDIVVSNKKGVFVFEQLK